MLFLLRVLFVAAVVDASALVGEDSSGNLVLDSRPGRERPLPPPSAPPTFSPRPPQKQIL